MELSLNNFRKSLSFNSQLGTFETINRIASNPERFKIDFDVFLPSIGKNLQRDFCWDINQKRALIISVLKGVNLLPLCIINSFDENDKNTRKIIDGKQRLSTMIDFFLNKFTLVVEDKEYFYKDLPSDIQNEIERFRFSVYEAFEYHDFLISDQEKIKWFDMINFAGTNVEQNHIDNLKNAINGK